jgi:hypothetical protein
MDKKMIHRKDQRKVDRECKPEWENQTPAAPTTKAPAGEAAETTAAPVCIKTKTLVRYRKGRRWKWKWAWKCCHELDAAKQAKQKECLAGDKSIEAGEVEKKKYVSHYQ